ncbi:hypothetical protein PG996_011192 [Apiospora saccharicola]|uniref:Uncharacterized protein n=1 Tax=Apiospora saccharicola TaxID=335842 RepID=A0ABR1UEE6_9PEZI
MFSGLSNHSRKTMHPVKRAWAIWMSFYWMVTRLAWMAHRLVSSTRRQSSCGGGGDPGGRGVHPGVPLDHHAHDRTRNPCGGSGSGFLAGGEGGGAGAGGFLLVLLGQLGLGGGGAGLGAREHTLRHPHRDAAGEFVGGGGGIAGGGGELVVAGAGLALPL